MLISFFKKDEPLDFGFDDDLIWLIQSQTKPSSKFLLENWLKGVVFFRKNIKNYEC